MLRRIIDSGCRDLLEMLAPTRCAWCGRTGAGDGCDACVASLPWNTDACRACAAPLPAGRCAEAGCCTACLIRAPAQDRTWAAFLYAPPVADRIVDLKFRARFAAGHELGTLMAGRLARRPEPLPELVIPVPLHERRLRSRGYNQALELARPVAQRLSLPLWPDVARRVRPTAEQSRLDAATRRRNVRAVFRVDRAVRGRHIALLDDVITTGATIGELARAARRAGARRIEVWAAARVA